jgi:uncharacterized protein YutE (UPF0331/DUF86 family)
MDNALIEQKIDALRHAVERVRLRCPATAQALRDDADAQDIVSLNLTRAVQLAVDVAAHVISRSGLPAPHTMGQSFERLEELGCIDAALCLRMRRAVGFRNIAVHSYETIDWDIVHSLCTQRLSDFSEFAQAVVRWLAQNSSP